MLWLARILILRLIRLDRLVIPWLTSPIPGRIWLLVSCPTHQLMLWPIRLWLWSAGVLILRLFYLFGSRDNAIHPQGICGLRNTKETSLRPSASRLQLQRNPPTWAVRCAQVLGYEPPYKRVSRRKVNKEKASYPSPLGTAPSTDSHATHSSILAA
jgi:hypothetical protein